MNEPLNAPCCYGGLRSFGQWTCIGIDLLRHKTDGFLSELPRNGNLLKYRRLFCGIMPWSIEGEFSQKILFLCMSTFSYFFDQFQLPENGKFR